MDLPLISSFVNSSISAALAEYVAPKSLTLDLKQMLTGDDFKKDTTARGVIYIRVKSAQDMKEGDGSIPLLKDGSNDCYVSCGKQILCRCCGSAALLMAVQVGGFTRVFFESRLPH